MILYLTPRTRSVWAHSLYFIQGQPRGIKLAGILKYAKTLLEQLSRPGTTCVMEAASAVCLFLPPRIGGPCVADWGIDV